jgi:threonine synthase
MGYWLECMACGAQYPSDEIRYECDRQVGDPPQRCGGLLDVRHDLGELRTQVSTQLFEGRVGAWSGANASGVWRYRELVLPVNEAEIVTRPEGNTPLYRSQRLMAWAGVDDLQIKHEGENPTGSFKDRGMTVGITQARHLGCGAVACASTGNTSASLAAYGALAGMKVWVFVPEGKIALGKLAQAVAYGARTLQVKGDFDAAMDLVRQVCDEMGVYLLNSVNAFRIEGQKTIIFEMLQQRNWQVPDWIVVPAGNLGNTSAFGKALEELRQLGLLTKMPRLACIQAAGANPFYLSFVDGFRERRRVSAKTLATAIRIGNPVSYERAIRALRWTNGVVSQVSDQEIMEAKAEIDAAGIGCEPASASALAGVRRLVAAGTIRKHESVVAVLTGHLLKDPEATLAYHLGQLEGIKSAGLGAPIVVEPNIGAVRRVFEGGGL